MRKLIYILICSPLLVFSQDTTVIHLMSRMDGRHTLENASQTNFWGYGYTSEDSITLPGPLLEIPKGDSVYLHFYNDSPENHTIHLHGLDASQANDGVPGTSFSVHDNDSATYRFLANHEGSYLYHCHVATTQHLAMGMYGMIVVADEDMRLGEDESLTYSKSKSYLFSDMDRGWNRDPLNPGPFNQYEASYFMVNGMSGSMLLDSLKEQIYIETVDTLRLNIANVGYEKVTVDIPVEVQSRIVCSDGRMLPDVLMNNELELFPGERYTLLLSSTAGYSGGINVLYTNLSTNEQNGENFIPITIESPEGVKEAKPSIDCFIQDGVLQFNCQERERFSLVDMQGRLVESGYTEAGLNQISLEGRAKGAYILTIGRVVVKVVY